MVHVYVLKSLSTGKIYIGQTRNLENRLRGHNGEFNRKARAYTEVNKGPWNLVYKEDYPTRPLALKREKQLKSAKGREFIKKILERDGGVCRTVYPPAGGLWR